MLERIERWGTVLIVVLAVAVVAMVAVGRWYGLEPPTVRQPPGPDWYDESGSPHH